MEVDTSYLNTLPGKYKVSCLVLGAIGMLGLLILHGTYQGLGDYSSAAGTCFTVTLVLLIILVCLPFLRQSIIMLWVELVITALLTIAYAYGTFTILKVTIDHLNHFNKHFIGFLIAAICSVLALLTYGADTLLKFREATSGSGSTSNV